MSNVSGIFPCNTKPQTKLRQKGHAVKRMGSSFSCTSSLHSPSCPTFPCKRLLPRLLSVPDLTSSLTALRDSIWTLEVQTHPFSGSSRQKTILCFPWPVFKSCNSDLRSPETCFCKVGQSEGIYSANEVFVVISEVLPTVNSVKWVDVLLLAVCPQSVGLY